MTVNGSDMKLTWYVAEKFEDGYPSKHQVSMCDYRYGTVMDCLSPSDLFGVGGCFDEAVEDYLDKLDYYINILKKFRDEIVTTEERYEEVIRVDYMNNPIKGDNNGN